MKQETILMALLLVLFSLTFFLTIGLFRQYDYFKKRETLVKEYCIEKGSRPNFCEEVFNDNR